MQDMSTSKTMPLGCLMIGIGGHQLTAHEIDQLLEPSVAGVILFSRNYQTPEQLRQLCDQIHALRHPRLLIGVDHEGGRVQRFRDRFTQIPPMRILGELYQQSPEPTLKKAREIGWLLATELLVCGVDFSFAPVLDLDYGASEVIGDRAFNDDPSTVARLALQLSFGMREAGMASVAKHFPGHGFVRADTHNEVAVDPRSWAQIKEADIQPFVKLIKRGLEAVMPAHVRYPAVDDLPVGFSKHWLQIILRGQYQFNGAIISDDLGMQAAAVYGDLTRRVELALKAGCDLVLLCNDLDQIDEVLQQLDWKSDQISQGRIARLAGRQYIESQDLKHHPLWLAAVKTVKKLEAATSV